MEFSLIISKEGSEFDCLKELKNWGKFYLLVEDNFEWKT